MTAAEAIAIAREAAREAGWTWLEPVQARRSRRFFVFGAASWDVVSNAASRGMQVRVRVDATTGRVLVKHQLPR